jgi:hypothetical protein
MLFVQDAPSPKSHAVRFDGTQFWVVHRRKEYGPFDYEWSKDFAGVELTYIGQKFGEYISDAELYADLKEFGLPTTVVEVSSILLGCVVYAVLNGLKDAERRALFVKRLSLAGHERFAEALCDAAGQE